MNSFHYHKGPGVGNESQFTNEKFEVSTGRARTCPQYRPFDPPFQVLDLTCCELLLSDEGDRSTDSYDSRRMEEGVTCRRGSAARCIPGLEGEG